MESVTAAGLQDLICDFGVDDIPWAGGKALFSWWNEARGANDFPARSDFSPLVMTPFLPTIMMHDVGGDARTYDLRLVGTAITDVLGYDPTGKKLDDLPATNLMRARFDWVLEKRKPYMCLGIPTRWANKDYKSYNTLVLPLGPAGGEVNILIANLSFALS
jgi:hypothetical protein